jgi:polysaccharide pyruvyl transferase WcaK-like protein
MKYVTNGVQRMANVLFLNLTRFDNLGSMGRIEGMIRFLKQTSSNPQIKIAHRYYAQDKDSLVKQLVDKYPDVEVVEHPWFNQNNKTLVSLAASLVGSLIIFSYLVIATKVLQRTPRRVQAVFDDCDVIIDLNLIEPDRFTKRFDLGASLGNLFALMNIWLAEDRGIPVFVCSSTVGPYSSQILRKIARLVLNKVDMISTRERFSFDYLHNIGVQTPQIFVTADLAFLLQAEDHEHSKKLLKDMAIELSDKPMIGIAPTAMKSPYVDQTTYVHMIAQLSDYCTQRFNASLVFIAHTYQDVFITQKIYEAVKDKTNIAVLPFGLSASQTKGVISECDMFICSRFHALVASTSSTVPSLALVAYSRQKFYGILGDLIDEANCIVDVGADFEYDRFFTDLKRRVEHLWVNRNELAKRLNDRIGTFKDNALRNGALLNTLLSSKK